MAPGPSVEITGDVEAWFAMFERGDFATIFDAEQAAIALANAKPLTLQPETAELMRLRPTLDASDD